MARKTIILDLDDCIADFKRAAFKMFQNNCQNPIHWSHWDSYDICSIHDITSKEFYSMIQTDGILNNLVLKKNVKETLDELRAYGCKIVIITSRDYVHDAESITARWLDKKKLPWDHLHISGGKLKKSHFANMYENVVLGVDDNVDNIVDLKNNSHVKKLLLMNAPWNINNDIKCDRINDISECLNYL